MKARGKMGSYSKFRDLEKTGRTLAKGSGTTANRNLKIKSEAKGHGGEGEVISPSSYQMTMATIFKTASFKLWQKLTKALPLGPIRPSMIPEFRREKRAAFQLESRPDVPTKLP